MNINTAYYYAFKHAHAVCDEYAPQWVQDVVQELVILHTTRGKAPSYRRAQYVLRGLAGRRYKGDVIYNTVDDVLDDEVIPSTSSPRTEDLVLCRELLRKTKLNQKQREAVYHYMCDDTLRHGGHRATGQMWYRARRALRKTANELTYRKI